MDKKLLMPELPQFAQPDNSLLLSLTGIKEVGVTSPGKCILQEDEIMPRRKLRQ